MNQNREGRHQARRGLADLAGPASPPVARRHRLLGVALSIAVHLVILVALFRAPTSPPRMVEPTPVLVELIDGRRLAPAPTPPAAPAPPTPPAPAAAAPVAPPQPAPIKPLARRAATKPPPDIETLATAAAHDDTPTSSPSAELSNAQLAGAESAGAGAAGGGCDMAGRLQDVLRKDPLVRAAVASSTGKAIMVWDGDWVWMNGDVGRGLTAVRQAMAWEIAFAPEACRSKPVHGLVVFSLNQARGSVRLAVGLDEWRWSDMLTPHPNIVRR